MPLYTWDIVWQNPSYRLDKCNCRRSTGPHKSFDCDVSFQGLQELPVLPWLKITIPWAKELHMLAIRVNYIELFILIQAFFPFCCFCRTPSICRTPKENAIRFQFSISERKQYHMFRDWVKLNLSKGRGYFLTIFISIYLWLIFCTSILNCMGVDRKTLFPASSIF